MTDHMRVEGLSVRYGGVVAIEALSLRIVGGQIVGLIGPNGAGKTTAIDAMTGATASTGAITFGERDISRSRPDRRARLGLARTWQSVELFDDMSVRENLLVSCEAYRPWWSFAVDMVLPTRARVGEDVNEALELLGIAELADLSPTELSHGQRKLVGIARALASSPKVVLLDEPAAGLDTDESRELGEHLRKVASRGVGVLLVDHDVSLVSAVCDYLYVLDFGRLIAEGPVARVLEDPEVLRAYLGTGSGEGAEVGERV